MEINEEILKKSKNNIQIGAKKTNILMDKLAKEWMHIGSQIKDPKPLFGSIWHQGEVAILFSNTGKGKSIFAIQLADAISKGSSLLDSTIEKQKVLYFDFEMSTKSFQLRYSTNNQNYYEFDEKLIRIEIDRTKSLESRKESFEELILKSIKTQVENYNPEVIIIDNITFLSAANEKSQEALALMKLILDLSRKNSLSILLIAHTPKRDVYRPIQLEDLAGSKALSNFVDVCFCIGESVQSSKTRYVKQLKNRNHPIVYGADNVINCSIQKNDSFLRFHFQGYGYEKDHLRVEESDNRHSEARVMKNSGKTNVDIGKHFGVSEKTIRNWLK